MGCAVGKAGSPMNRFQLGSVGSLLALLHLQVAGFASAAGHGAPAAPQRAAPPTFFESIDVEVVNVDVVVTDRQGQAATGLGRDDFSVFEDGKAVPITNFYAAEESEGGGPPAVDSPRPER